MRRTGLSRRLQQQSRRSGFAVGLSMVVAIAMCFAAFTWIYVQLEPWVQDFAGAEEAPPTPAPRRAAENEDDGGDDEPAPTRTTEPEPEPNAVDEQEAEIEERPTEQSDEFQPDYVLSTGEAVNFRSEPSTAAGGATIIDQVTPGTPLQATGETSPADTPDNGPWIEFRLEDGTEGWLREIDVSQT